MVIVGGIGSVYDSLLAAAIRGLGFHAIALGTPDHAALMRGRALLTRGHPASVYYLAGALVDAVSALDDASSPLTFATLGGHCGHYGSVYREALTAAGHEHVLVLAPSLAMFASAVPGQLDAGFAAGLGRALLRACITADVVVRMGCEYRTCASDRRRVDWLLGEGLAELVRAMESRRATGPALAAMSDSLSQAGRDAPAEKPLRVRITGEFFASMTDGDASHGLVHWLESRGALVEPPLLTEWLLYALWQLAPTRSERIRSAIRRAYTRAAVAAGLSRTHIDDPAGLAELALPYYASDLRGGAGHLEVGAFLAAEQLDRADLVVSVKAFASTPSSSVSDAVLHALTRSSRVSFVSMETTGDAEMQAESRLELALDMAARSRAAASRATGPRTVPGAVIAQHSTHSGTHASITGSL